MHVEIRELNDYDVGYSGSMGLSAICYRDQINGTLAYIEVVEAWLAEKNARDGWYALLTFDDDDLEYFWTFRVEDNKVPRDHMHLGPASTIPRLTTWPPKK